MKRVRAGTDATNTYEKEVDELYKEAITLLAMAFESLSRQEPKAINSSVCPNNWAEDVHTTA